MFKKKLSEMYKSEIEFTPFIVTEEAELCGNYSETVGRSGYTLSCDTADYKDTFYIKECVGGYTVKRVFKNTSGAVMRIRELGVRLGGISFGADTKKDYYYHLDNPRMFCVMTLTVDCDRMDMNAPESEFDPVAANKWSDPGVITERVGSSPYQPFPALLVSNPAVKWGLVHGTLSQKVFYHNYLISHSGDKVVVNIYSSFKAVPYREVRANEILEDEWYIGRTDNADNIEKIFSEYTVELRKKLPANYGATSINRDNMTWGTWNDGIRRNVSEELILSEAKELVEHFPNVKWIQIDDGYCALDEKIAHGLGVPYEGEEGVSKTKFPHGMRYISDKIKEFGLRPAIWIGGACPEVSRISKERPEIMIDYLSKRREYPSNPIDVSLPEGREYMTYALDTIISDWGFEGVKHDFWSYAFEVSEPLLRNKYASGYEHRRWWLSEIRRRLPSDGYLQTGCDIVMANPFLGEYFTNYRYGTDIGPGKWSDVRINFTFGIACFATHTGDLFVPNSDSIGMLPGLSDIDAEFCINYILITRSMVELAGVFSKADKTSKRFAMLKKATCNVNNGQDIYFTHYDYRKNDTYPDTIYLRTPHFSKELSEGAPLRTFGIFNIEEDEKTTVTVKASELGLDPCEEYVLTNVWTGERQILRGEIEYELIPHESRLISVNRACGRQIYDANIELSEISATENKISAVTHYATKRAELTLSEGVKEIRFNGEPIAYSACEEKTVFELPGAGLLEIVF